MGKGASMTSSCGDCRFFERLPEEHPIVGIVGKCALAREKFAGDVTRRWSSPTCKGFESTKPKSTAGRRR